MRATWKDAGKRTGQFHAQSVRKGVGGNVRRWNNQGMIRIREIMDPELRQRITAALAERRGCSAAAIPEWFELDDLDYVDLLNDLKEQDQTEQDDWRM